MRNDLMTLKEVCKETAELIEMAEQLLKRIEAELRR